ncbi:MULTISPECIES: hypothetical protein [unclassified Rhodococcus (in: high G+C Gram-positive bacteria)]|uniref:hypothetical protein n=1 Tax=unclassified Rhodococcus (in: high G+C Gram-positive bacteria) TaxID=192944 RepID=UPI000AE80375
MTGALAERSVTVPDARDRDDLSTFLTHAARLDPGAVVRLRRRGDSHVVAWIETGFDVLAARVIRARVLPSDVTVAADGLLSAMRSAGPAPFDPGFGMDSAWRGPVPPDAGWTHVDDVPGPVFVELAERGVALAREHGTDHGPPVSLLDQDVVTVEADGEAVPVSMRMIFALNAMKFVPTVSDSSRSADDARVRVRIARSWIRLDARYGSVFRSRGATIPLMVS